MSKHWSLLGCLALAVTGCFYVRYEADAGPRPGTAAGGTSDSGGMNGNAGGASGGSVATGGAGGNTTGSGGNTSTAGSVGNGGEPGEGGSGGGGGDEVCPADCNDNLGVCKGTTCVGPWRFNYSVAGTSVDSELVEVSWEPGQGDAAFGSARVAGEVSGTTFTIAIGGPVDLRGRALGASVFLDANEIEVRLTARSENGSTASSLPVAVVSESSLGWEHLALDIDSPPTVDASFQPDRITHIELVIDSVGADPLVLYYGDIVIQ